MALVLDSNYGFHGVLVDAGNGKVLGSIQMSMAAMMQMGMMGPGMGMMGPGMMQGPGMMTGTLEILVPSVTNQSKNPLSFIFEQAFLVVLFDYYPFQV